MIKYIAIIYILVNSLYAISTDTIEQLTNSQDKLEQSFWFNKGVLELRNKHYKKAIFIFNKTKKMNKFPSLLNIAVATYKLNNNKKLVLNLFENLTRENIKEDNLYVYLSANMYLYKITNRKEYLKKIISEFNLVIDSSDNTRNILSDALIEIGKYKKAAFVRDKNKDVDIYKKAILSLINNNLQDAKIYLNETLDATYDDNRKLEIYWFLTYIDLKLNNITNIENDINHLQNLAHKSYINEKYPLKLTVNSNKYDLDYYLKKIKTLNLKTKIDLVFYFTPYKFANETQMQYSITNSFFLAKKSTIDNITNMTKYNRLLLDVVQGDPYVMRDKLERFDYKKKKSYMYFNLALAHARIGEYKDAMEQFQLAFNLNPSNKLYALYILLSAKQIDKTLKAHKSLKMLLNQSYGKHALKAKVLSKLLLTSAKVSTGDIYGIADDRLGEYIEYLYCINNKKDCKNLAFFEDNMDPIKNLLYLSLNNKKSEYLYISNIQDNIQDNIQMKKTLPIVYKFFINYLKGIGLTDHIKDLNKIESFAALDIKSNLEIDIYTKKHSKYISKYMDISEKYDMHGADELFLQVAAMISNNREEEDIYSIISYMNILYKDPNSSFLIAIRYLRLNEFDKALESLNGTFDHPYIDFKLDGLDKLLKEI